MRVQEGSTVHIPNAPIWMVGGLPVLFCLVDQAPQRLPLFPLSLAAGGQVWLCCAIGKHLVLHQHCTHRSPGCTLPSTCGHSCSMGCVQDLSDCVSLKGAARHEGCAQSCLVSKSVMLYGTTLCRTRITHG